MAEKLNPLKAWLGVDVAKPSYYQLFGLQNFESEPPVIADAADRAIRKAQKHTGGEHREAAEKLVRDLTTVKNVLLSTEKRQAYDQQLRKQLGGAPSGGAANPQRPATAPVSMLPQSVEATDSPTMMLPPGALSAALSSLPMPGMPQPAMPPGAAPYGAANPYGAAPGYADPMQGMYAPQAGVPQPGLPQPTAGFGQPYGQGYGAPAGFPPAGQDPAAMFNYGPPPTAAGAPDPFGGMQAPGMPQPVMATAAAAPAMGMSPQPQPSAGFAPQVSTGRIRAAASRKQQQSNITMAIGVLGVAAVILVVVIVIANKKSTDQAAEQNQLALLTKSPPPQPKPIPPLAAASIPLNTTPAANNTPAPAAGANSGPSEMERLQRMQIPNMPAPSTDSAMPSNSGMSTTMPAPTSTAPAAPALTIRGVTAEAPLMEASLPEDAARAKSVPAMLSAARASFRTRDYAKAEEVILSAQITADTPALIELARGHSRALDLVRTFWDAVRLGLKSVKPGDELIFAGKSAAVVSADETNLIVKLENKDVPLVVDKLIPLVAAQLAEKALPKDDPGSKLVVAVFLLLDQPAGVERGKQLFDEATVAGLDVNSLRPLLNAE
ncbi:MAG: hypothetical protein JNK76_02590 [Planctomycetales bacterium]|nr:hypothetical protein [Planctomycetales bacterium]